MKKLTTSEKVLQFLINKNHSFNNNNVNFTQEDANKLNLPEQEIIRAFFLLQTDGCLKITQSNNEDNFDKYWSFELKSDGIRYFEKKNEIRKANRNKWIQFWIPVGISMVALLKSFSNEIISLWKLIMQLWK